MSRSADRGKKHERRVVAWHREHGYAATRDPAKLEPDGRATGVDVRAAVNDVQLAIQVRDSKRVNVWQALADARAGALASEIPLAFCRRVTQEWPEPAEDVVIISVADWFQLLALVSGSVTGARVTGRGNGPCGDRPDFFPPQEDDA